jgi:hypothetical protein
MFVCPYDAEWCNRGACRTGTCEMTGERPSVVCLGCGALVDRRAPLRLCAECVFAELPEEESKGA